ncbi:translocation/assembly module TamB domain-containing protein [Hydrogenimonas sp.]
MGRLYVRLATLLQGLLIAGGLFLYVTLHPVTTDYIARKALTQNGVGFERIDGNIFVGFDLYGLTYQKAFYARHVGVYYNIFALLSPRPTIREVLVQRADLYPDRLKISESNASKQSAPGLYLPPILLERARIEGFTLHLPQRVTADATIDDLRYFQKRLTTPAVALKISSPWAEGRFEGAFDGETLHGTLGASPAARWRREALAHLRTIPHEVKFSLDLDEKGVKTSLLRPLRFEAKEANATLDLASLTLHYRFGPAYLDGKLAGTIQTPALAADFNQTLVLTPHPAYATTLEARITRSAEPLPADRLTIRASGDDTVLVADARLGPFSLDAYSTDYRRFALHAEAVPHTLTYLRHLPGFFARQKVASHADATLTLAPSPALEGVVQVDGNYTAITGSVEWRPESLLVKSTVRPKATEGGIWREIPPIFHHDIHAYLFVSAANKLFYLSTKEAYITLFEREGAIKGWADIASLTMDAKGRIGSDDTVDLRFFTRIDSLYALMERLGYHTQTTIDAQVESRFHLRLSDTLYLGYDITLPWYLVQPDSQTVYYGLDSRLYGAIEGERITLQGYDIGFGDRRFVQHRPSSFRIDDNATLVVERFALFDRGEIAGRYAIPEERGDFRFEARGMHYRGPEGNLTIDGAVDLNLTRDTMDAEGEIELLEGVITYLPKKSYTVNDEDIVIIQDVREPSHTEKRLDIHIFADKPIRYQIPMATVDFKPDVTIWKEPFKDTVLLGIVRITGGSIDVEDKHFTIEPSEIYFGGAHPPNPYLDLHILYTYDFKRFHIYVSHTLADPVFLFSSEPPMSQNDIMSYILFGTPASEAFGGGGGPGGSMASMLLGLGIKHAIGAATGLKFDTFNIIENEEGRFGFEVGTRIGKRFRIIYRNDTLSSIILQYTLSQSVRVDVDVKETGQGINILYVKDFRGPKFLLNRR